MDTQLSDAVIERVRTLALALPGTASSDEGGMTVFLVEGTPFARLDRARATLALRDSEGWRDIAIAEPDCDWRDVDERIARSWELSAPQRLLEAGGR